MNKKAIAILGLIFFLIVGTLLFLIYSKYSGSKNTADKGNINATTTPTDLNNLPDDLATTTPPQQASSNIVKLTSEQVLSPALFYNGNGITYFDRAGSLYQAGFQDNGGKIELLEKKKLDIPVKGNLSKILWPLKGDNFIAEFTTAGGQKTWSFFDSATQAYTDFPSQVTAVDWMPTGNKIMYIWTENGKSTLNIGDPDTKNWQFVGDMWENDDAINISPDGTQILYFQTANASADNAINVVSSDGKLWRTLVKNGQNYGVLWSPDGQKFLFGKKDSSTQKYQLWVYNLTSGEVKNLGLFTNTEKVLWDKDSNIIYAAVPNLGNLGSNSLTSDNFFRMDITTMEKKQYQQDTEFSIDGRDLLLNILSDKLFFRNAQDGGLYYLDLTK